MREKSAGMRKEEMGKPRQVRSVSPAGCLVQTRDQGVCLLRVLTLCGGHEAFCRTLRHCAHVSAQHPRFSSRPGRGHSLCRVLFLA